MGGNASQTEYGTAVSTSKGKSAINALNTPVTETSTSNSSCSNVSTCKSNSYYFSGGATANISCGGQNYFITYNSSSASSATQFCAQLGSSSGSWVNGAITSCNCSSFYPKGSYCNTYYGC